ncbi:MAG: hypothetical protein JW904_01910 [Spirochaetales bacterium]|nr:hypothetical protein [Spirochaetales bacterium]
MNDILPTDNISSAQPFMNLANIGLLILFIASVAACVFIFWKIAHKTGLPGFLSLGMFIPVLNIFLIAIFALITWPIEKELAEYRKKYGPLIKQEKPEFDDLPICAKCQTPIPPGAKNCVNCGWPDKYKDIV